MGKKNIREKKKTNFERFEAEAHLTYSGNEYGLNLMA